MPEYGVYHDSFIELDEKNKKRTKAYPIVSRVRFMPMYVDLDEEMNFKEGGDIIGEESKVEEEDQEADGSEDPDGVV